MKTLILEAYNHPLRLIERERPLLDQDEVLLKVRACGICQTDLKIIRGEIPPPIVTLPHILGHEVAGEVVALGDKVSGIRTGDLGVVYSYVTCHACERCMTGRENICNSVRRVGFELDGGFAEYLKIPAYNFCSFRKDLPLHQMAILPDAIGTTYHAVMTQSGIKAGQNMLIVGSGGLGIHALQFAKLCGARVLVVDRDQNALTLARQYGADETLSPEEAPSRIADLTQGEGVDVVIEIVGSPETLSWSLPSLKRGGRLIIVGYAPGRPFPLDTMLMHYREYEIVGCRFVTKAELLQIIKLVEQGKITPVVTKTYPFEQANEALNDLRDQRSIGRTVLTF